MDQTPNQPQHHPPPDLDFQQQYDYQILLPHETITTQNYFTNDYDSKQLVLNYPTVQSEYENIVDFNQAHQILQKKTQLNQNHQYDSLNNPFRQLNFYSSISSEDENLLPKDNVTKNLLLPLLKNEKIYFYETFSLEKIDLLKHLNSKIPWSDDRSFEFANIETKLSVRLQNFSFQTYFGNRLRKRKNILGTPLKTSQILKFQKSPLSNSLFLHDDLKSEKNSCKVFVMVLQFIEEKQTKALYTIANNILHIVAQDPKIIDECFCQIVKQLNNCPQKGFTIRLYQLFAIYLYSFLPSKSLTLSILNYLQSRYIQVKDMDESQFIRYIFPRFIRGLATQMDSIYQISYSLLLALITQKQVRDYKNISVHQLPVQIYLTSGQSFTVYVEDYENIYQLKQKIMKLLEIDEEIIPIEFFSIYQVENSETVLKEKYCLEQQFVWELVQAQDEDQKNVQFFVFKVSWMYVYQENDELSRYLFFSQGVYDLMTGKIRLSKSDNESIVAALLNTQDYFKHFILPLAFISKNNFNQQFVEGIQQRRDSSEQIKSKIQNTIKDILETLSGSDFFMGNHFQCELWQNEIKVNDNIKFLIKSYVIIFHSNHGFFRRIQIASIKEWIMHEEKKEITFKDDLEEEFAIKSIDYLQINELYQQFQQIMIDQKTQIEQQNILNQNEINYLNQDFNYDINYDSFIKKENILFEQQQQQYNEQQQQKEQNDQIEPKIDDFVYDIN